MKPEGPLAFQEEREWFSSFGWSDPRIAERFGMEWRTYTRYIARNGLPPAVNPAYEQERRHAAWLKSVGIRSRGDRHRRMA